MRWGEEREGGREGGGRGGPPTACLPASFCSGRVPGPPLFLSGRTSGSALPFSAAALELQPHQPFRRPFFHGALRATPTVKRKADFPESSGGPGGAQSPSPEGRLKPGPAGSQVVPSGLLPSQASAPAAPGAKGWARLTSGWGGGAQQVSPPGAPEEGPRPPPSFSRGGGGLRGRPKRPTWVSPRARARRRVLTLLSLLPLQRGERPGGRVGAALQEALGRHLHRQLQPLPETNGRQEVLGRRAGEKV